MPMHHGRQNSFMLSALSPEVLSLKSDFRQIDNLKIKEHEASGNVRTGTRTGMKERAPENDRTPFCKCCSNFCKQFKCPKNRLASGIFDLLPNDLEYIEKTSRLEPVKKQAVSIKRAWAPRKGQLKDHRGDPPLCLWGPMKAYTAAGCLRNHKENHLSSS